MLKFMILSFSLLHAAVQVYFRKLQPTSSIIFLFTCLPLLHSKPMNKIFVLLSLPFTLMFNAFEKLHLKSKCKWVATRKWALNLFVNTKNRTDHAWTLSNLQTQKSAQIQKLIWMLAVFRYIKTPFSVF